MRGDGRVTREDYEAAVRRTFDSFDANHDGVLSQEEVASVFDSMREIERRESAEEFAMRAAADYARILPTCAIPRPSPEAKAYFVMATFTTAVSDVTFGNTGAPAGVADIIAPIRAPEPCGWPISPTT